MVYFISLLVLFVLLQLVYILSTLMLNAINRICCKIQIFVLYILVENVLQQLEKHQQQETFKKFFFCSYFLTL